jgi:DNA adenine methylase
LKWPGGKRWLADTVAALFSKRDRYVEPFLGGGAVYFTLKPRTAILADINEDLIAAFTSVRDHPSAVIRRLSVLRINRETFRRYRGASPDTMLDRAVRLLYLNRTAFNGIYRVNAKGRFNVPFGCKKGTKVCDGENLRACSRALKGSTLTSADFRTVLREVRVSDAIYIDPPYTVKHDNNGFRRYNERIFSWNDQVDLARKLNFLAENGAEVVVSNACHKEVSGLYSRQDFAVVEIERASCVAGDAQHRGPCKELLLISRSIGRHADLDGIFKSSGVRARLVAGIR